MTTQDGTKPLCAEVEEALAQVLDGTAPASLYDHIADCDTCRDLRHEATVASEKVSHAGADFRPGASADAQATEAYLSGVTKRLDEALVSSGRVSGSRDTLRAGDAPATVAEAAQGTMRGMPMVDAEEIRAAAQRARERAALDAHPTTIDPRPSTLAVGDDRRSDALATAPTAFAPLSVLRDGSASEREPTRLMPLVGAEPPAPERAPSTDRQPLAPAPVPPTAPGSAPETMRETQPATEFAIDDRQRLQAELHRPAETLASPSSPPPAGSGAAPARWLKTEPLAEHLRGARATGGSQGGVVSATTHHGDSIRTPHAAGAGEATGTAPVPAAPGAVVATAPAAVRRSNVMALFRRKPFVIGVAGAMAVAAAAGFALRMKLASTKTADVDDPWSGSVVAVSRAAADKEGGLEACSDKRGCWTVAAGAEIKPGWKLKTDSRTRAHVKLSDGTELAIDRGSEVELTAGKKRTARLVQGMIVADVTTIADAPAAHFAFPTGDVEVLGTKLALTADAERATVEVVRGTVRVHDDAGKVVEVRAGEEATLSRGSEPTVASSTSLADVLEWSDRTPEEVDAPVLRGLGELRAKKPGETKERDRAVRLSKHAVKVRVVDVVARTEVDETFTNDTDEELEGIFRFPLPPGAQIERLALEVDGKLLDGAFVDRDRGAAIWRGVIQNAAPKAPKPREEIIWVPGPWRDPALLEWQRGGRFELKIFPIPKRGSRRVVLTYTQPVEQAAGVRRFTYPLAHDQSGTTKVDSFDLDLQVLGNDKAFGVKTRGYELTSASSDGGGERKVLHADSFVPAGDLTVEYALPDRDREVTAWGYKMDAPAVPASAAKPAAAVAAKPKTPEEKAAAEAALAIASDASPYVAIAVRPKLPRWQESKGRVHAIVVDTSRSMIGERFSRATRLASTIVREMDRRDSFVVLACDTTCRAMSASGAARPGSAAPMAPGATSAGEVERFLGTIEPDGGSDLVAAVSAARSAAGPLSGKELRVLYLGDGTPTVGPTRSAHIEAAVKAALPASDGGVVAVALGSDADTHSLQALARGGGGVVIPYVPGQKVSSAAIDVLAAAYGVVLRDPEVELPSGLSQVTPARLDPIRAGGETFVLARMSGGNEVNGTIKLKGRVAGERFEQTYPLKVLASTNAGNAFVPRLFAAAKIAELERSGGDDAVKPTIVELSRRFAVASRFTSLLVLESEAMFNAFGLERGSVAPSFTGEQQAESSSADADGEADENPYSKEEAEGAFGGGKGRSAGVAPRAKSPVKLGAAEGGGGFDGKDKSKPGDFGSATGGSHAQSGPPAAAAPAAPPRPDFDAPAEPRTEAKKADGVAQNQPSPSATMAPPARRPPMGRPVMPTDDFRGRRMIPMKRIFERKASFDTLNTLAQQNAAKMVVAESALSTTPDSRDKTVELFALYSTSGRIGEAQELTARWSGRDALDPDAITARADLAARQGDRERAVRILSGLTDVRPGDKAPQLRLADLHETGGNPALACQHRITAAELAPGDAKLVADAIRCARNQGMVDLAGMLKADAPQKVREAIEKALLSTPATAASSVRGDVQITAEWSGAGDLDIALIDAQGRRISWMGSPSKAVTVSARDAISPRSETLGLTGLGSGSYVVEVSRAAGADSGEPARGELTLRLAGETRKVPFTLTGARAEVGSVKVFFTSRLVPVDNLGWR